MSIIICVIEKQENFYLASDLRANRLGSTTDDFKKVFELKEQIYFGMTGIAEEGFPLLKKIQTEGFATTKELINRVDKIFQPSKRMLTVMLCGRDKFNSFFCWQKNNSGETATMSNNVSSIGFSISTNRNIDRYNNHLALMLNMRVSVEDSIKSTIEYASKNDDTISPTYNLIKHSHID